VHSYDLEKDKESKVDILILGKMLVLIYVYSISKIFGGSLTLLEFHTWSP